MERSGLQRKIHDHSESIVRGRINLPKNGKIRRVDMSDALIDLLQELRRKRKEEWLAKGQNEIPDMGFLQSGRQYS